jgi:hypothetical protein
LGSGWTFGSGSGFRSGHETQRWIDGRFILAISGPLGYSYDSVSGDFEHHSEARKKTTNKPALTTPDPL